MNLDYDRDELEVLRAGGDFFTKIAPNPVIGTLEQPDLWSVIMESGWGSLGAEFSGGDVPMAVGVDLFRQAGAQLVIEDLVTSAYILSKLTTGIVEPELRATITGRLRDRRGLLLGDGRRQFLPLATEETSDGFCFGSVGDCDIYRLINRRGGPVLQCWTGQAPEMHPLGGLSPAVTLVSVAGDGGAWLDAPIGWDDADLRVLEREASLLHSSALVGCGERLLHLSCQYANDRVQFGVPISSFQAVKHLLADVHAGLCVAWNAILAAAAEGADPAFAGLVARFLAVEGALASARVGAQVHGGLGFTAEANVHLFLKAILDGAMRGGTSDHVAIELGRHLLDTLC